MSFLLSGWLACEQCQTSQSASPGVLCGGTGDQRRHTNQGDDHQRTPVDCVEPRPRLRATKVAQTPADDQCRAANQWVESNPGKCWRPGQTGQHERPPIDGDHHHYHQVLTAPKDRQQSASRIDQPRRPDQRPAADSFVGCPNGPGDDDDHNDRGKYGRRQLEMEETHVTGGGQTLPSAGQDNWPGAQRQQQVHLNRPQSGSRHLPAGALAGIPLEPAGYPIRQVAIGDAGGRSKVADNDHGAGHKQPQQLASEREVLRPKTNVKSLISRFNMS